MNTDFSDVMKNKSDKKLIEIISLYRHEYLGEAIQAAEEEIERRHLDVEHIQRELLIPHKIDDQPFNKKYLFIGSILLFPISLFIFSLFKEEIGGVFLLPLLLISFLPCGALVIILARKEAKKNPEDSRSINALVSQTQIIFGIIMTVFGIICTIVLIRLLFFIF
ncbi:MAG: hypothetical protein K0R51_3217 [Cytophagaceae bacterium]|jgi:Ca2+/Na+ antiporter|nr:hypothetical protein [Cytophagaceae bacterium]